jgi:hypothetical protein
MSVSIKQLVANDQITGITDATVDTMYTASNLTAQINAATVHNSDVSAVDISVYILPSGVAATAVDPVAVQNIAAGESEVLADLIGHVVPKDGTLVAFAGTTNVLRVTVSGLEIT